MTIDALIVACDALEKAMRDESVALYVPENGRFVALDDTRDDDAAVHRIINTSVVAR